MEELLKIKFSAIRCICGIKIFCRFFESVNHLLGTAELPGSRDTSFDFKVFSFYGQTF